MAFIHHYPFDFKLLNDKGEDEFYLEDKLSFVNLAITNSSGSPIDIKKSLGDYHFALKFRPGTLNTANGQEQTVSNWKISSPQNGGEDGCMLVKLTYTGDLLQVKNAETLNIKFNLNIDGSLGTRSTNVLLLDNVSALGKSRQINWTIINHRGKPNLPLELTFKDADTILNDGITANGLSFRISNTNKNSSGANPHIHFNSDASEGPVSRIYIYFDTGDNAAQVLANASTAKDITVAVDQSSLFTFEDHSKDPLPAWIFKASQDLCLLPHISADTNDPNKLVISKSPSHNRTEITTIDFNVANIKTNYITGRTRMYVRFENIPDYWDDTFVLEIDKQPLVMKGDRVGIGTNQPYFKLDVQGNGIGFNTGNKSDHMYLSHDGATAAITAGGAENGLALKIGNGSSGSYNDQPYAEAMRLLPNGNVGIGTNNPRNNLEVGNTTSNQSLRIGGIYRGKGTYTATGQETSRHQLLFSSWRDNFPDTVGAKVAAINRTAWNSGGWDLVQNTDLAFYTLGDVPNSDDTTTEKVRITSSGNVGIGTSSPAFKLQLQVNNPSLNLPLFLRNVNGTENAGNAVGIGFLNEQLGDWPKAAIVHERTGGYGVGSIKFLVSNQINQTPVSLTDTRMTITSNGNVGIGINTPGVKLHVLGSTPSGATGFTPGANVGIDSSSNNYINFRNTADNGTNAGLVMTDNNNGGYVVFHNYDGGAISDSMVYGAYQDHVFQTGPTDTIAGKAEAMRIKQNGNVGIGTTNPQVPLEINRTGTAYCSEINDQVARMRYQWNSNRGNDYIGGLTDRGTSQSQAGMSIHAHGGILAQFYYAYSDKRVKTHIENVDAPANLSLINNLRVADYNYKDYLANGVQRRRGLIAQEVMQIMPQAVSQKPGFIPDIFSMAEKAIVTNECLLIAMKEKHGLTTGDKVRLYSTDNRSNDVEVTVIDDFNFTVADWKETPESLFVYGRYTNDVHVLDYNEVFCTGISAIQELSKQVDELKGKMQAQETTLKELQELVQVSLINNN